MRSAVIHCEPAISALFGTSRRLAARDHLDGRPRRGTVGDVRLAVVPKRRERPGALVRHEA
jgi:hypothetical protein